MDRLYAMRFVDWMLHPYPLPVPPPVAPLCSHTEAGPPGCVCAQHYSDEDLLHFKVPCP